VSLLEKQLLFAKLTMQLEARFLAVGYSFKRAQSLRSDEQAAINALKEEGRLALSSHLETDPRFHALAVAVKNNGKADGILLSVHCVALAQDYDLFKRENDHWIYCSSTEDHRPFGEWWEQLHELCRWGGRFRDGNHYSFEHEGRC